MLFCTACGQPVTESDRFCHKCGASQSLRAAPTERPGLVHLFLYELDAAKPRRSLFGSPYFDFATAAMVEAFVYRQCAMVGMAGASFPEEVSRLVLNEPSRSLVEDFRARSVRLEDARLAQTPSLEHMSAGMYYLQSIHPEVYRPGAMFDNKREADRALRQKVKPEEASAMWGRAALAGLGLAFLLWQAQNWFIYGLLDSEPRLYNWIFDRIGIGI